MPHMAPAWYWPDELACVAAMNTGMDKLWSGITVDVPSDVKLDGIKGEAGPDLEKTRNPPLEREAAQNTIK